MKLNTVKTTCMLINVTKSLKKITSLTLKNTQIETVVKMKLLGTIITIVLKWNKNTNHLIKKAYARMEILGKIKGFTKSTFGKFQIKLNIYQKQC